MTVENRRRRTTKEERGEQGSHNVVDNVDGSNQRKQGTLALNGNSQLKQGNSVATMVESSVAKIMAAMQPNPGKKSPAKKKLTGLNSNIEQLEVVSIMVDHVMEVVLQETVGDSDKHMVVTLTKRKQSKHGSVREFPALAEGGVGGDVSGAHAHANKITPNQVIVEVDVPKPLELANSMDSTAPLEPLEYYSDAQIGSSFSF
ncbi:hypothetical protein V6N12_035900 [Hibiscus sabdariffa]|uniref:Uncharacterized protein n=1 Tax=Hibiscus sabdariffa TaxID=183260 RepID=A0ABR2EP29_9ROSI